MCIHTNITMATSTYAHQHRTNCTNEKHRTTANIHITHSWRTQHIPPGAIRSTHTLISWNTASSLVHSHTNTHTHTHTHSHPTMFAALFYLLLNHSTGNSDSCLCLSREYYMTYVTEPLICLLICLLHLCSCIVTGYSFLVMLCEDLGSMCVCVCVFVLVNITFSSHTNNIDFTAHDST